MSSNIGFSNNWDQTTEIFYSDILSGDQGVLRHRLAAAMESLGYDVIEDDPSLVGRRSARGWGTWYGSADVLDYGSTLTIRFRSAGENSVRVSFDYLIKHGWVNKGEKEIVVQEARTLSALARIPMIARSCTRCGLESTDDSRFCRSCGSPLTSESSDLEVLRLMAESRAGKTSVVAGSLMMVPALIGMCAAFALLAAGAVDLGSALLIFGISAGVMLFAVLVSFFAWNRLRRALDVPADKAPPSRYAGPPADAAVRPHLPEQRQYTSITEGTTNLLDPEWADDRERVSVPRSRTTNELE